MGLIVGIELEFVKMDNFCQNICTSKPLHFCDGHLLKSVCVYENDMYTYINDNIDSNRTSKIHRWTIETEAKCF